jgi:hypothetical protein
MDRHDATSSEAATDLHVGVSTLQSWAAKGLVQPKWRTPGGHARWDIDDLRKQLGLPSEGAADEQAITRGHDHLDDDQRRG